MRRRILLAEDDTHLSAFVEEVLRRNGYTVLTAHHGYAALERLQREQVDLLLTDVMLPGVTGDVLAERARAARPGLGVVFMTGSYGLPFVLPHDAVLRKPFSEEELLAAVARAVGPEP